MTDADCGTPGGSACHPTLPRVTLRAVPTSADDPPAMRHAIAACRLLLAIYGDVLLDFDLDDDGNVANVYSPVTGSAQATEGVG